MRAFLQLASAQFNAWGLLFLIPVVAAALFALRLLAIARKNSDARLVILRRLSLAAMIILALGMVSSAVISWCVQTTDGRYYYDGFGRRHTKVPAFVEMILSGDHYWIGWTWALVDLTVFCLGVYAIYRLWYLYLWLAESQKIK